MCALFLGACPTEKAQASSCPAPVTTLQPYLHYRHPNSATHPLTVRPPRPPARVLRPMLVVVLRVDVGAAGSQQARLAVERGRRDDLWAAGQRASDCDYQPGLPQQHWSLN